MRLRIGTVIGIGWLLLAPGATAQELDLKPSWPVGKRLVYRMDMFQTQTTVIAGSPSVMEQEIQQVLDQAISVLREPDSENRRVKLDVLSFKMVMKMMGMTVSFDSESDPDEDRGNPMAMALRLLADAKIEFLFDPQGRLLEVSGVEELSRAIPENAPAAGAVFEEMFSDDALERMLNMGVTVNEPPGVVQVGDSWDCATSLPLPGVGTLQIDADCTYSGRETREERECDVIDASGTLASEAGPEQDGPAGVQMEIEGGKWTSKSWYDPELGIYVGSSVEQEMTMLVELPDGFTAEAQNATTTMVQTIKMNLVSDESLDSPAHSPSTP